MTNMGKSLRRVYHKAGPTWLRNYATPVLVLTVVQIWVPDFALIVVVISINERTRTVASYFRRFYSDEH
jgi:hypothetical protein